jgi:hypothetical protein
LPFFSFRPSFETLAQYQSSFTHCIILLLSLTVILKVSVLW